MSVRRSLILLALLVLGMPFAVFSRQAQQYQAQNAARDLQVYTVERGDVEVTITAVGEIEADQTAELSFTSAGRVQSILVEAGDYILAGDVLVELDSDMQQLSYEQALLTLENAQLSLDDLLAGPDDADIRIAEAQVDAAWGAYNAIANAVSDEDVQAAQLRYEQAQQAYIDANRARQVAGGNSETEIELLNAQIGQASFNAEIARLQLDQLQGGNQPQLNAAYARVTQAQAEVERVKAGATEAQIEAAEAAVEREQLNVDQAQQALERRRITAPFDGFLSTVAVEVGALVAPGLPLGTLTDIEPLSLTVQVDEIDIRRLTEGMPATIQIDALGGIGLEAQVEQIALVGSPQDGVISYPVRLSLTGDSSTVRVGMTAEAAMIVESRRDVLVVPNAYIRLERRQNRAYVNVLNGDGNLEEIEISLGLQGLETSEVLGGLSENDRIVVDLSSDLSIFGG